MVPIVLDQMLENNLVPLTLTMAIEQLLSYPVYLQVQLFGLRFQSDPLGSYRSLICPFFLFIFLGMRLDVWSFAFERRCFRN